MKYFLKCIEFKRERFDISFIQSVKEVIHAKRKGESYKQTYEGYIHPDTLWISQDKSFEFTVDKPPSNAIGAVTVVKSGS